MRFLQQETLLTFPKSIVNQDYILTIGSEVTIGELKKIQLAEKKITIEAFSNNSSNFEAKITTILNKIKLNSLYKKQETLSKKIAFLIKDVHLQLNNKNEIVKVLNHQKIIENWCQLKSSLEKRFKGKHAENYFQGIGKRIENHDSLIQNFRQLKGFGLIWFMPLGIYKSDFNHKSKRIIDNMVNNIPVSIDESITLLFADEKEIKFNISGSLSKEQKHENKIKHYLKSQLNNEEAFFELKNYTGYCNYNVETGLINEIQLEIKSSYGSKYKKTQSYSLIKSQY